MTVKGRTMCHMSEAASVPTWTLGWRLKRALAFAHMSAEQMAAEIGVHPATVSRWMNDREPVKRRAYLVAWAVRTGVPLDWLIGHTGAESDERSSRPRHLELDLDRPTTQEVLALRKELHGDRRGALNRRTDSNPQRVTA